MTCVKKEPVFISPEREYDFSDDYNFLARRDHFWVRWRFEVLRKVVPDGWIAGDFLDVGCGNGVVRDETEKAYRVVVSGCDVNSRALRLAGLGRGQFYYYDILDKHAPFRNAFDGVLLMDVLEHVESPVIFLRTIAWHLKDGGKLVVNVPAWPSLYSSFDKVQGHVKRYVLRDLKEELNAAGFEVRVITYWGMLLLPVIWIRTVLLKLIPRLGTVKACSTSNAFTDLVMSWVMRIELLASRWPWGTSVMAIAVKK